jgi:Ras-related GTP-binding protein A/B
MDKSNEKETFKKILLMDKSKEKETFTKILLMGNKGVGKTSIKSIIFQQQLPKDTLKLAPTNEVEEVHSQLMGHINIHLIDCCSKEDYMNKYFDTKKKKFFSEVNILVFVTEIFSSDDKDKQVKKYNEDIEYFLK